MTECFPPWEPDPTLSQIVFADAFGYAIPNYAVRFVDDASFRIGIRQGKGEDVVTIGKAWPYPLVEKNRSAPLPMEMNYLFDPTGVAHPDPHTGAVVNLRTLNAIANLSATAPHGLQTINWFPHDGRPNLTFEAHVSAPVLGANVQGKGCKVGIVITIPDPSTMAVIP
ncbi:MAG: hypothetical protein EKK55_22345 [Rhodocyclaceae bacterium]|nr:MAG: hypothetical protein EKK55_22345 [Rhodocyclaceae bacterium]